MSSSNASHVGPDLPDLDDRLVKPGTRYEMLDGELVYVAPADEPHGERHSRIAAVVEAHAAADFKVACDMLTRTSKVDDFAPDVSVYPRARHPETGRRQLEQLVFEIVSTESLSHAGHKAAKLAKRGVRRIFAIDLDRERALEWSRSLGTWSVLDINAHLMDPALAAALPVAELLSAAKADDAMARALIIKRNPLIEQVRQQGKDRGFIEGKDQGFIEGKDQGFIEGKDQGFIEGQEQGLARGRVEALLAMLDARGIAVASADRARIVDERDAATLARWTVRAATCSDVAQLFEDA